MNTLRIALCEDDVDHRQNLLALIQDNPISTAVTPYVSGEEFLLKFKPYQYDLILMDIFMDTLTGIDVITQVRTQDKQVPVAFITTSMDFTLESYRLDALKYIEKPATKDQVADLLQMAQMKQQTLDAITIRIQNQPTPIPVHKILYCEQHGRSLDIHLSNGKTLSIPKKMKDMEELLMGKHFLRCHKSYLVNLAHIQSINRELCTFILTTGEMVYIRNRSFWEMQRAFETYLFTVSGGACHA